MIKNINTKIFIATISVLGLGIFQQTEASSLKDKLSNLLSKAKTAVSTANNVLTTINNKSTTAANSAAFGTVLNNVSSLNDKLTLDSGVQDAQTLLQEYQQLEILRQTAQTQGATVQDKVNYLNAYNTFKQKVTLAIQNSNVTLQQKENEYNTAKSENEMLTKMNSGADAGYTASAQVPLTNTVGTASSTTAGTTLGQ